MYQVAGGLSLQLFGVEIALAGLGSGAVSGGALGFSPLKILGLVVWVYLCMYSIQRIEYHPLLSSRYKPIANVFSFVIGPLLLFVLVVAETSRKIQDGEIEYKDILKVVFGNTLQRRGQRHIKQKAIELMDSSGRSFTEIYGGQDRDDESNTEVVHVTESIVLDSIDERASDVLIDPQTGGVYTVRFRVDGLLRTVSEIDTEKCAAIVNSIKAISGMDIAERRRPQDGAFMARTPEGDVFFRVASAGVLGGEKLSIRVLNQQTGLLRLDQVGLSEKSYKALADAVNQPSGVVLICGPTGSGKTTSLYAMLNNIDFFTRNVVTVEDPIEYVLANVSQIEVNVKANITFANALRSILRQDPDVICVGEIRDSETAAMALQSSQTGHLVLATLHSRSNMATLVRLMDLGIKPLLLASALSVIISQRLVRKLCEHCKTPAQLSDKQIESFKRKKINYKAIMTPRGCRHCGDTGFRGRTAILDVMYLDDKVKANMMNNALSLGDLKRDGDDMGRSNLKKEGLKKVLLGITTFDEVKRVTSNLG